jgi:hypothetical protein
VYGAVPPVASVAEAAAVVTVEVPGEATPATRLAPVVAMAACAELMTTGVVELSVYRRV